MKGIKYKSVLYSFLSCLLIVLFACEEDKNNLIPSGYLYLNVEGDATLHTKAQTGVTFESLRVDVLDMNRDTVNIYKDYLSDVKDQRMTLPVGKYIVSVSSNHTGEAGWETPLYRGEEEVEVKQGEITSAQVVCKITNTKVSVLYSENMKDYFSHYGTTVSNSSGSLTFTRDEYRSGYFTPEELTVSLKLVNRDGNEFVIRKIYPDIKPQYHYKFKFDLADEGEDKEAGADFGIEIDSTNYEEIQYNIFIKEEESLFGKGVPKLKLTGFGEEDGENKSLSWKPLKNGEQQPLPDPAPQLTLDVPTGIQEVKIDVNSARFSSTDLNIDKSVEGEQVVELNELLKNAYSWSDLKAPETHSFAIRVLDSLNQEAAIDFSLIIAPDLPAETDDANAFATFAFLKGSSDEKENVRFKYWEKSVGVGSAQEISANANGDGSFEQVIKDLKPNTEYCYQALAGEDVEGNVKEFITADTPIVPNLNFDNWYKDGKSWYANLDLSGNYFWDSGNKGANTLSAVNPTSPEEIVVIKGKAARLESKEVAGVFAAGSLYTGTFGKVEGLSGASLNFGRPYTGCPTKLTGYYKYIPKEIKKGEHGELKPGSMDKCIIYIVLCDWTAPFTVNTKTETFVDLSAPYVLAYGELSDAEASLTMEEYQKFEIDIKYRDIKKKPTYILIVASSSKYGDYFTGGVGSTLYLDEFELSFDYNNKSFE